MNELHVKIQELANRRQAILNAMRSTDVYALRGPSSKTKIAYERQARQLLHRTLHTEGGLFAVAQSTSRITTFRKRLVALEHFLGSEQEQLTREMSAPVMHAAEILHLRFLLHLKHLQALQRLRQEGMTGERAKRRSKRQSLAGLPANWRIALCKRAVGGRYLFSLIVLALTGCRPSELVHGIDVWRGKDETTGKLLIHFRIRGAKVKDSQGQPLRTIAYDTNDPHPLVVVVNELLDTQPEPRVFAQIRSAVNLTVEIRRLARSLWPKHAQSITAYCFRH